MEREDHALWTFSLALGGAPEVSETCLALQDSAGVDVNLLLWAAWLGAARGVALDAALLAEAEALVAPWREEVVRPLRAARRAMPRGMALRAQASALELAAERHQQDLLHALAARLPVAEGREALARANLAMIPGVTEPAAALLAGRAVAVARRLIPPLRR